VGSEMCIPDWMLAGPVDTSAPKAMNLKSFKPDGRRRDGEADCEPRQHGADPRVTGKSHLDSL
jgi:hypothetical protein